MKLLRFIVALAVVGYAGWLAWPFLSPFLEGAGPDVAASRMGAEAQSGGELFGFLPAWTLWAGAVGLYLVAALMLGAGNPKAAVAYFLGFIADAVLRLAMQQGGGDAARSAGPTTMAAPEAMGGLPVDPLWLVLGGLFLLGVLVVVAGRRIRRKREAGQLNF
ncbi:MAG: hypothetical protein KKE42_00445 [Alphaproteobacteria bacterium]|uniref:hypothetical protein n=1 Tax=Brevundimonas sp. TaxID=1871086 RepID=UPI00184AD16B|nr:hypothetical protein [Brevundimonas sp.]MBU3971733.1 hypothetical protein [Alphaproteobacteria bacterium]MBA3050594.1 hypothetical protein [Brevundimonas sp.]MBU3972247.1 hypothetical protein [Alphaproteobacteria bacterium]MBU4038641.1 hypothetical protein [Alphaproteobacteria bacterium]MBU4137432.1 hypothetical protein [Alphaproteobacteria bacterium]